MLVRVTSHQHTDKLWVVTCWFCSRIGDCAPEGRSQRVPELHKSKEVFRHSLMYETSENLAGLMNGKVMGK